MGDQSAKHRSTALDAALAMGSVVAIWVFLLGGMFAVSMSGSWIPVLVYGIPASIAVGALYYWRRLKTSRRSGADDQVPNTLSWKREVTTALLILSGIGLAVFLHFRVQRERELTSQPKTEQASIPDASPGLSFQR